MAKRKTWLPAVLLTPLLVAGLAMPVSAQEGFSGRPIYQDSRQPLAVDADASKVEDTSRGEFPALIVPEEMESEDAAVGGEGLAGPVVTTVSSLLVVLAIFGALVWVSRRYGSARGPAGALPEDVLRNLGTTSIDAKTRVSFLRVGRRILVIGQTANGDPQTLSEICDPDEVERLTNRCMGRPEIVGRRGSFSDSDGRPRRDLAAG